MQKFLRTLMLAAVMLLPFASQAQNVPMTVTIGDSTATTSSYYVPVNNYFNYSLSEMIIDADEINSAMNITSISFYYATENTMEDATDVRIYLQSTDKTVFSSSSDIEAISPAAVMVYSGNLNCTHGWNTFTFSTPYLYDGESNLMIIVHDNATGYDGTAYKFAYSPCTGSKSLAWYSDSSNPYADGSLNSSASKATYQYRPVMALNGNQVTLDGCRKVRNLVVDDAATTSSSLTLTWTDSLNASATYTVYNGEVVVASGITTTTYTVTGLNANTEYTFGVEANCSATDNASLSYATGRTACAATQAVPYTENFSAYSNLPSYPYSGPSVTPYCWDYFSNGANNAETTGSSYFGGVSQYSYTSSYGAIAANDPYLCLPIYVIGSAVTGQTYLDNLAARGNTKYAILPAFDQSLTNLQISFDYKMSTTYSATAAASVLELGYVTGDTATFVSMQQYNATTTLQHVSDLNLSTLAAQAPAGARLAFKFSGVHNGTAATSNSTVYVGIDNISVEELPSCFHVTSLAVSATTSSSLTLTWNDEVNANATYSVYNISDSSLIISGITATPGSTSNVATYTVTGLNSNTNYTFGVVANCSATDASEIETVSGLTDCGTETMPWSETFDEWNSKSPCWMFMSGAFSGTPTSYASAWTLNTSYGSYITITGKALTMNVYSTNRYWAVTPAINITSDNAMLSVDVAVSAWSAAAPNYDADDTLALAVSTDNGASFTTLRILDNTELNTLGNTYTTISAPVSGYNGETVRFAIFAGSSASGGDNRIAIDNVTVAEAPSCLPVTNLTVVSVTDSSASFSWHGEANSYIIYDMVDSSILATTADTTFFFSGLLPNTLFGLGVAAVCGTDDESEISYVMFRTACGAVALPYTESFELTNTYNCWDFVSNNTANDVNSSNGMGLVALGNSIVWRFSSYTSASDYNQYGYSPVLDASTLTGVDAIRARVRYATYGSNDKLNFGYIEGNDTVWDPTDYTTSGQSDFREYEALIPLTATKVAIHYYGSFSYYAWIDTVELTGFTIPPCDAPTNVSFVGADTNIIAIAWDGDSTALYAIFDMSDTSLLGTITGNSAYINGLTPSTQYTFGVATVCDYSISDTVTVNANTACGAVAIPFTEDFEATSNTIGCWTIEGNNSWSLGVGDYSTSTGAFQGAQNARITHGTTGDATKLISPVLSGAENGLQLTFAHVQRSWSGDVDELRVYFRTDTASAWQQLVAYTDAVPTWTVETINIPSAAYQVAFEYTDNWGYGVGLDSVVFNMPPSCMPAAALTVDSANATSISLSWTGNAASYTVYNMSDTTVLGTTTTTSFTVTGLTAMTAYTFGVAANCGNEVSEIVSVNAATACGGTTCNITIAGTDAYGDGWNGNAINVMQAGATIGTFTLTSGASYTESFSVCSGTPVAFAWVEGSYADEASFQILDGGNTTVHSVADGSTLVNGAVFYTLTDACPACLPAVITVDNVAETSVTISWTGNATSYDVYNGTTLVTNTTATTYTFTGLNAATSYTFGVQAICSATDSASMATVNVMTACADITVLPYTEGFENGLGCWTTVNGSSDGMPWFTTNSSSSLVAHSGNAMAASVSYYSGAMHANAWLISPKFVLPTINAGDSLNFAWWHKVSSYYPTELYDVMISTTTNDTAAFTTTLLAVNPDSTDDWVNNVVNLNTYAGQSVYIAFHHHDSYDQNYLLIDDVTLSVGAAPVPVPDTLTVTFAVENATMGTTVPAPGTYQYITGDTVRFQAVPNNGYHFTGWIMSANGDNDTLGAEYISAYVPANVVMSYGSMTLTALFEAGNPDSTTITYAVNDATMGTTVPAPGTHTIYVGNTIQAAAIPNPGYMLNAWVFDILVAGNVVSSDTLYSDDPDFANPMVFGTVPQSYVTTYNASFGVTAIFAVDTNASTDDITVVLAVNDATMGTTNPAPGTYTFAVGDSASVAAIANNGYHFVNWIVSMGGVVLDSSLTEATYSIDALPAMLAGMTLNVMANFAADSTPQPVYWTVSVSSANDTMGTVTPAGDTLVLSGDSITVHAIANEGFHFAYWMTGNNRVTDQADFTFTVVANTALVAVFESDTVEPTQYYHVTGLSNDNAMGYVELVGSEIPSALVEDGETVTLIAHANAGYRFVRWSTGETTESINITVDGEDVTVTAYFELVTGIEDADMNDVTIYSTDSKIVVRGAEGSTVYVFDVNGRLVSNMANSTETVEFRMANTGVYLVKVGAAPAKRVLVVR